MIAGEFETLADLVRRLRCYSNHDGSECAEVEWLLKVAADELERLDPNAEEPELVCVVYP